MKQKYKDWIEKHYPEETGYGKCYEATEQMVKEFPELERIRGLYYCLGWGERCHWWCKTAEGEIIDPTAGQFPSKGFGHYEEWQEDWKEPTGKCPNCGELCYDDEYFCTPECGKSFVAYLNEGRNL